MDHTRLQKRLSNARERGQNILRDDEFTEHAGQALRAGSRLSSRVARNRGLSGHVRKLLDDEDLRADAKAFMRELVAARERATHKPTARRGRTLLAAGVGVGALAWLLKSDERRRKLREKLSAARAAIREIADTTVEEGIELDAPVETLFASWSRFEDFPSFMHGIEAVTRIDEERHIWSATVAGRHVEWTSQITEREPNARIAWKVTDGEGPSGVVTFHRLDDRRSRLMVQMASARKSSMAARTASLPGTAKRQVRADLERFKERIERQALEASASPLSRTN